MPSPIIAIDLIKKAMIKIGALAVGETPSAAEAQDGLAALNDVLESWSLESLSVYGSMPETFTTVAGQAIYSLGAGGDWATARPTIINGLYTNVDGIDFPASEWSIGEYNSVGLKTQQQAIVQRWVYVNDAPLSKIILWPTPARAVPITIDAPRILTNVATIAVQLFLPPGYVRALQYAVGEELASEYGSIIDVSARARATKALLKRANRTARVSQLDPALMGYGFGGNPSTAFAAGAAPDQWSETQW